MSILWSVWPGITKVKLGVHPLVCHDLELQRVSWVSKGKICYLRMNKVLKGLCNPKCCDCDHWHFKCNLSCFKSQRLSSTHMHLTSWHVNQFDVMSWHVNVTCHSFSSVNALLTFSYATGDDRSQIWMMNDMAVFSPNEVWCCLLWEQEIILYNK